MTLMEEILYRDTKNFTEAAKQVYSFAEPTKRLAMPAEYAQLAKIPHTLPYLQDFSPLHQATTLVVTPDSVCDRLSCDPQGPDKGRGAWLQRLPAGVCADDTTTSDCVRAAANVGLVLKPPTAPST